MRFFGGLGLTLAVASAAATPACSDDFEACRETRTCGPAPAGGGSGEGPTAGESGEGGSAGAVSNGGASGEGAAPSPGGAGSGGTPACESDADCDNDDPADGVERCNDGACLAGNAPPAVVSVTPNDMASDAEPDGTITIEFSEPLAAATVIADNIKVLDGDVEIPGELAHSGTSVVFTPAARLALLASHTISVTTAVTDADGAGLLEDFSAEFTVRDGVWSDVEQVQANGAGVIALAPTLPVDGSGNAFVSWIGVTGTVYCPATARWFSPTTGLGVISLLNSPVQDCQFIRSAANTGSIAAVSWQGSGLEASQFRNDAWASTQLNPDFNPGAVGVAPTGEVHVVNATSPGMEARHTNAGGVWSGTTDVLSGEATKGLAALTFDSQGNGFAVWRAIDATNHEKIAVSRYAASVGMWSAATAITGSTAAATGVNQERGDPAVAVDGDGNAMAVWVQESGATAHVVASRFTAAGGWAAPAPLDTVTGTLSLDAPALVFDGESFVAAWNQNVSAVINTYSARYTSGAWQTSELRSGGLLSGVARMPTLGADAHGNLLLVWPRVTTAANTYDVVQARYIAATGIWSAAAKSMSAQVHNDDILSASGNASGLLLGVGGNGVAAVAWLDADASVNIFLSQFR